MDHMKLNKIKRCFYSRFLYPDGKWNGISMHSGVFQVWGMLCSILW